MIYNQIQGFLESKKSEIQKRKLQNHEIQRLPVHQYFLCHEKNLVRLYGIRKMCLQRKK